MSKYRDALNIEEVREDMKNFSDTLSFSLVIARHGKGFSQEDVAAITGIPQRDISLYEAGTRLPTLPRMVVLSNLYERPIDALVAKNTEGYCRVTMCKDCTHWGRGECDVWGKRTRDVEYCSRGGKK